MQRVRDERREPDDRCVHERRSAALHGRRFGHGIGAAATLTGTTVALATSALLLLTIA